MPVRNNGQHGSRTWVAEAGLHGTDTPDGDSGRYAALAENRLVEMARTDPEAFGELYRRNADRIYTYVFYRVGSAADAEDLTARTFYQALGGIHRYVDQGVPFVAWLYRIAHNLVANYHRNRARWKETSLDQLEMQRLTPSAGGSRAADRPDRTVEVTERQQALVSAIRRQPEERQRLLILKFTERLSNEEIGRMMGRTESSIKSLYFRTLRALRADLEARGWHGS
jgi:RNA polymerase sigma-70 factor, ECF subfamily